MQKPVITLSLSAFLLCILSFPGKAQVNLTNGLVAYYPFSGNANDASGNGNNAVFNNATLTTDRFGNPNSAYYFDGISNYIQIPDAASLDPANALSVALYFNPARNGLQTLIGKIAYSLGTATQFQVAMDFSLYPGVLFGVNPFANGCTAAPLNGSYVNTGGTVSPNQWYCLVGTFDNGVQKIYLNGALIQTQTASFTTLNQCSNAGIQMGMWWPGDPQAYQGKIDEVRIYNRALDSDEVSALCSLETCPSLTVPVPEFSFDENVCNPLQVNFSSAAPAGTTYDWLINGTPFAGASPSFLFGQYGSYPVKLKWTDGAGCTDSVLTTIQVQMQPGKLISTPDTTLCVGKSLPLKTVPVLESCWSPATYLDNPALANPLATPPLTTKYYFTAKTLGANLVTNGDFSNGNTGFTNGYIYDPVNVTEGEYFVGPSPHSWDVFNPVNCGDHTSGTGNMLLINGYPAPGISVWQQQVNVTPNTQYAISAWIESLSPQNPATLQFSINGIPLASLIQASSTACTWQPFTTTWNSGSNTTALINLVDDSIVRAGNDFALDDISFATIQTQMDSVTVTVEKPAVTALPNTTICRGMPVSLQAGGAATYSWSPGSFLSDSTIADPVAISGVATSYTVTGTTSDGCTAKSTVLVAVFPNTALILTPDTTICLGDPAPLQAGGGISYTWSPSQFLDNPGIASPVARPVRTTRFFLTVVDPDHCAENDSVTVSIRPMPVFQAPPGEASVCAGSFVMLGVKDANPYKYAWSPAGSLSDPSSPTPLASPAVATLYTVRVSDAVCGQYDSSFSVHVDVRPIPVVVAQKANDIDCSIATAQLNVTGATSYAWSPAEGLSDPRSASPVASIDSTTTFIVRGTDRNGCFAFDTVSVKVTATGRNLFVVPNAFSPNGDGHNDCFGIRRWGDVTIEEFSVFDRWGVRVFTTRNPSECWDGNFRGKPQEAGTYPYVIKARSFCGQITRTGVVVLVR